MTENENSMGKDVSSSQNTKSPVMSSLFSDSNKIRFSRIPDKKDTTGETVPKKASVSRPAAKKPVNKHEFDNYTVFVGNLPSRVLVAYDHLSFGHSEAFGCPKEIFFVWDDKVDSISFRGRGVDSNLLFRQEASEEGGGDKKQPEQGQEVCECVHRVRLYGCCRCSSFSEQHRTFRVFFRLGFPGAPHRGGPRHSCEAGGQEQEQAHSVRRQPSVRRGRGGAPRLLRDGAAEAADEHRRASGERGERSTDPHEGHAEGQGIRLRGPEGRDDGAVTSSLPSRCRWLCWWTAGSSGADR